MKKIKFILIVIILITIHALIFLLVIGNRDKSIHINKISSKSIPKSKRGTIYSSHIKKKSTVLDDFPVSDLFSEKVSSSVSKTTYFRPRISPPFKNKQGYLCNNLPNRHTKKVYASLVRSPYRGAIIVDVKTKRVLFKDHETSYGYPASLTKLMTFLLVLENIHNGKIHLFDHVKITDEIAKIGGSQIWLDPREKNFTVDDLLYALMVHSANDAAYALALHIAGTRKRFVQMMNQKARKLGMNATTYHSPHGLPPNDGSQPDISTAHNIALLSLAVLQYPETLHYTNTERKYLRNKKTILITRNNLIKKSGGYLGCDGLKTGYHAKGGWSISVTAKRKNHRIVVVLLGCPNKKIRTEQARKLLDKGFKILQGREIR